MKAYINEEPELELMGDAKVNTFAFRFSKNSKLGLTCYSIIDAMKEKGWSLVGL